MATNDYHFITHWRVKGTAEEVAEVLADAPSLPCWWPSVYLDVKEVEPGGENHVGRVISLYTKGWLPYTLRWSFRVTQADPPHGSALEAWGDFNGRGIWTIEQDGPWVDATYDWKIRADKPLLRNFSFIMKPIFSANHRWAMAKGEESLRLELARREQARLVAAARAGSPDAPPFHPVPIPDPPGPTFANPAPWLLLAAAAGLLIIPLSRRLAKRGARAL